MATIPSIARSTANRAVHLRITPRPSNIGESREIMRLLSHFGPLEHFQNLKYDKRPAVNTVIAIYKDEEAANECMKRSPIRFRMERTNTRTVGNVDQAVNPATKQEQMQTETPTQSAESLGRNRSPRRNAQKDSSAWGLPPPVNQISRRSLSTNALPKPKTPPPLDLPFAGAPSSLDTLETRNSRLQRTLGHNFEDADGELQDPSKPSSRLFQILASPSRRSFRDQLKMGHFHGSFKIDSKNIAQEDLAARVPVKGLSDCNWKGVERPWAVVERERRMDGSYRESGERKSLRELWEEGRVKTEGGGGEQSMVRGVNT